MSLVSVDFKNYKVKKLKSIFITFNIMKFEENVKFNSNKRGLTFENRTISNVAL
jgi:hypothetical protein